MVAAGQSSARSPIMDRMRLQQLPQVVPAPVARATALMLAAPPSIAVVTSSLVTARQMHANTFRWFLSLPGPLW
jgi:hypothetical protein